MVKTIISNAADGRWIQVGELKPATSLTATTDVAAPAEPTSQAMNMSSLMPRTVLSEVMRGSRVGTSYSRTEESSLRRPPWGLRLMAGSFGWLATG